MKLCLHPLVLAVAVVVALPASEAFANADATKPAGAASAVTADQASAPGRLEPVALAPVPETSQITRAGGENKVVASSPPRPAAEDTSNKCIGGKDKDGKSCQVQVAGKMYPPASQLSTWPMRIFVTTNIPDGVVPTLSVLFGHTIPSAANGGRPDIESGTCGKLDAVHVARNQLWSGGANIDGQNSEHSGTWLLFDLRQCQIPFYKPMGRAQLVLHWPGDGKPCVDCTLVSPQETNVGTPAAAVVYSILTLAAFTLLIVVIIKISGCSIVGFFLTNNRLSLSMVQMALWTYTVGFVVLFDLFVRLDAANIPSSLIVLMTSSLLTAGVSSTIVGGSKTGSTADGLTDAERTELNDSKTTQGRKDDLDEKKKRFVEATKLPGASVLARPADVNPPTPNQPSPASKKIRDRLLELFTLESDPADGSKLSLSRVQMLFWTVVIIIMFVAKSLLSPELWEIPWTLVALMGVSQLGYLAGKYGYAPPAAK